MHVTLLDDICKDWSLDTTTTNRKNSAVFCPAGPRPGVGRLGKPRADSTRVRVLRQGEATEREGAVSKGLGFNSEFTFVKSTVSGVRSRKWVDGREATYLYASDNHKQNFQCGSGQV